jgi:hypothetical protein
MYYIGYGSMIGVKLSNKTAIFFENIAFIIEPYPM